MREFDGTLKPGFVLAKPITQENYEPEVVEQLDREGRLIKTRKRDGWKMFAGFAPDSTVRLYTDGMNEIDDRLLHIKVMLRKLGLKRALFAGEAVMDEHNNDDLAKVGAIMHSGLEKALETQRLHRKLSYMVFNIIILDGKPVDAGYGEVLEKIDALLKNNPIRYVFRVPVLDCSLKEAQKISNDRRWEGLVLYDKDFRITFREDGKSPLRPKGCYKWKPIFEDDFIVRECVMRDGGEEVKELVLLQKDPNTGKEFPCGKLGSFTREMRRKLADPKLYPLVVQAAFEARYEKSGKIRNARFMRLRTDKRIKDCIAPRSFSPGK